MWERRQQYCYQKMEESRIAKAYQQHERRKSIHYRENTYEKQRRKSDGKYWRHMSSMQEK